MKKFLNTLLVLSVATIIGSLYLIKKSLEVTIVDNDIAIQNDSALTRHRARAQKYNYSKNSNQRNSKKIIRVQKLYRKTLKGGKRANSKSGGPIVTEITLTDEKTIHVEYVIEDNLVIGQGDIVLGHVSNFKLKDGEKIPIKLPKKWPNNTVPYVLTKNISNHSRIISAINEYNDRTNLHFKKRRSEKNFIQFVKGKKNCYSYVGMKGGFQQVYLEDRCETGHIIHELMHVLGFFHEQNRKDRDEFIQIHWWNINSKNYSQFKKLPMKFLPIEHYPFDFDSIMLYGPSSFAQDKLYATISRVNGDLYEANADKLSYWDIEKINAAYPH